MILKEQVLTQARRLTGELDQRQNALLEVLCDAAVTALGAMLKEGYTQEDCANVFPVAAALYALAAMEDAGEGISIAEFKAGDLTVKKGGREGAASQVLRQQADALMGPFVKDRVCFLGV